MAIMVEAGPHESEEQAKLPEPALAFPPSGSEMSRQRQRSERALKIMLRLIFMVLLVTISVLVIASSAEGPQDFDIGTIVGAFVTLVAVGLIVILIDTLTPKKRLAPAVGVFLGICLALIGALAVASLIDVVAQAWELTDPDSPDPFVELAKVVVGIILCYLAVSFVLTTKDNFRLVIPYVEFAKQVRGIRPLVLDTSVLIDGRIDNLVQTGFVDAPLVVPRFVVEELQALSDSGDRLKRARGRRGLDMVAKLLGNALVDVSIDDTEIPGRSVDRMLVELARAEHMRILTTDYNLAKVAGIHGVAVLNINDLANGLKPSVIPGEMLSVEIVKLGENEGQGVGYLADGTMVVVEEAATRVGETVELTVTNSLQTSAGRMIFGRVVAGSPAPAGPRNVEDIVPRVAETATHQPRRGAEGSAHDRPHSPGRSPRR